VSQRVQSHMRAEAEGASVDVTVFEDRWHGHHHLSQHVRRRVNAGGGGGARVAVAATAVIHADARHHGRGAVRELQRHLRVRVYAARRVRRRDGEEEKQARVVQQVQAA
jgi:hypothetical protein